MVDFEQYPDTLKYNDLGGITIEVKCRFKPSYGGRYFIGQDGNKILFQYDIAFPEGTAPIPTATLIDAFDRSGYQFVSQQELMEFHIGQLHCFGRI